MANKGSKADFESAAKAPAGRVATPAVAPDAVDPERELPRNRTEKRREPLHAFIVHFDAEPSSKPLPPDYPDRQA